MHPPYRYASRYALEPLPSHTYQPLPPIAAEPAIRFALSVAPAQQSGQTLLSLLRCATFGSMPAKLTLQDKLALSLTSAGSMRNLGALVGVTHQKIGRWLRGDTPIPREATKAINLAFKIHSEISRDQAAVEGLPFDPSTPVFITRPDLIKKVPVVVGMNANGTPKVRIRPKRFPGQRAIVSKSDYMSPDLVARAVEPLMRSPLFGAVTARSVIKAKDAIKQRVSGFQSLMRQLDDRELAPNDPIRRYTDYSNKTRFSPPDEVAADLQAKLEQRAQYALTPADSVVFFMPRTDDERPIIKKRKRKRSRR